MLSVCIPIYNFDVNTAVKELHRQLMVSAIDFEILLLDDESRDEFKLLNKNLIKLDHIQYTELIKNVGRSKIRNLLADRAIYSDILFLDCDVIIHNKHFISNYLQCINASEIVICGGRVYPDKKPSQDQKLRWKYGLKSESQSAKVRSENPSQSFMTNNFIIKKEVFDAIRFNEELSDYGHEDTLFGYDLKTKSIIPKHIENPVLNGDIETDAVFLQKTEEGIRNLSIIYSKLKNKEGLIQDITLLRMYSKLSRQSLVLNVLGKFDWLFIKILKSGFTSITIFNLYKLSIFINYQK